MSIFDKIQERLTGLVRLDWFGRQPLSMAFTEQETGETRPVMDRCTQHQLVLELGVQFWANKAQYHDAKVIAKRSLANLLYRDVLSDLAGIEHAISDGNKLAALKRCA